MACNINSIKTGQVGKNGGFSGTHRTSYIRKKSKPISSPKQNYFIRFVLRYPVVRGFCRKRYVRKSLVDDQNTDIVVICIRRSILLSKLLSPFTFITFYVLGLMTKKSYAQVLAVDFQKGRPQNKQIQKDYFDHLFLSLNLRRGALVDNN